MILQKKNLLYYRSQTSPGPSYIPYLSVVPGDSYTLDYQISTGTETGVADIEQTSTFSYQSDWFRMIGYYSSWNKWFLGMYQNSFYSVFIGTQFGSLGDCTVTIFDSTWNEKLYNKRNLYYFGNGFVKILETPGNWIEGSRIASNTGTPYSWTSLIGYNIRIGLESTWRISYNLYGLRIYDTGTSTSLGNLVAEYLPVEVNGVPQLYNTVTGNYITKN